MSTPSEHKQLQKVNKIPQRYKNIVFGFIKESQKLLPDNNPYFYIVALVQHCILLYFYNAIESSILTELEQSEFYELLQKNNKSIHNQDWNLIFRLSRDLKDKDDASNGYMADRKLFIDRVHGKQDIVVFVETICGNVFGGYTKQGWKKKENDRSRTYTKDEDAFVFSIRSNKGWNMKISNVKPDGSDKALAHSSGTYLNFGSTWIFYQNSGILRHQNPNNYDSFGQHLYLLGGKSTSMVKEIEAFQLSER